MPFQSPFYKVTFFYLIFILFSHSESLSAQILNTDWVNDILGKNVTEGQAEARSIAVDASENIYVCGFFTGAVDFNPDATNETIHTSKGQEDIFVLKYSPSGKLEWVFCAGSEKSDKGLTLGIDNKSNIYISGFFSANSKFNNTTLSSKGAEDVFLAKFTSGGLMVFAKQFGGSGTDYPTALTINSKDDIFICGNFDLSLKTESDENKELISAGQTDIFIVKYDGIGNCNHAAQLGGSDRDFANAITTDRNNNLYIAGKFENNLEASKKSVQSFGASDILIAKYDSEMNLEWLYNAGGPEEDEANALVTDSKNNVYITGSFSGTAEFNPVTGNSSLVSTGAKDAFFMVLDEKGWLTKVEKLGGISDDIGSTICTDNSMIIYGGTFSESAETGSGNNLKKLKSDKNTTAAYVVKYNSNGQLESAEQLSTTRSDKINAMTCGILGDLFICGTIRSNGLNKSFTTRQKKFAIQNQLKIKYVNFTALRPSVDEVFLNWSTESEYENAGFEVERMLEGSEEFYGIGFIEGFGTTKKPTNYRFTDINGFDGMSFYRLKQTNYDGEINYSDVIGVMGLPNSKPGSITLYPLPVDEKLNIRFGKIPKDIKSAKISIKNINGSSIFEFDAGVASSEMLEVEEVKTLNKGRYLVEVLYNTGLIVKQEFVRE
jgi:hypothetical protein